ncbi:MULTISPECIES: histidine kinase [unclassified Dehalobacter]|uniref:sensor histidine kinase n=1 Tax=unclassified Dehalobacter TaxID=2635733 RepID=UPI000E6B6B31|nr:MULTISPECIES: histidine kinase [unclassified Dehalobacter]RJE47479.1 two-component sensor histidine kinase [Dehalobacter sp. MCB1]TCX48709.1 sensor histidine kinase [Dehalobacter sp. 14DCB1]TCX56243.1 sensor histidine kinase [Dehalobacter sp. 12DCB1]
MTGWLLGTKLIIILYSIFCYILTGMANLPLVLLLLLIYVITSMLQIIFPRKSLKKFLTLLIGVFLILSIVYASELFIFLLPLNLLDLFHQYGKNPLFALIPATIPLFLLTGDMLPGYLLIVLLSTLIYMLSLKSSLRIASLTMDNDHLRGKNHSLYGRLRTGSEYETQVKYLTQLEERNALAQNIHDKIGHVLAGSLFQLEAARLVIEKDQNRSQEIIANVIHVLKEGMEDIRSTLRTIKPAPEQLGINRLKVILDEVAYNSQIKTHLNYRGDLNCITHAQWRIILENVREALTNTLKYSSADKVKINLEIMHKLIKVEIKDNGVGAVAIKKGLGLKGMEERTEVNGGKLILDGSSGFSVITLLPVKGAENAN